MLLFSQPLGTLTPTETFKVVRSTFGAPTALLESALTDESNPFSFIAFNPVQEVITTQESFEAIRVALDKCQQLPSHYRLSGGLIGTFNWEVFHEIEPPKAGLNQSDYRETPHAIFYEFSRYIIFDHQSQQLICIDTENTDQALFQSETQKLLDKVKNGPEHSVNNIQNEKNADFSRFTSEQNESEFTQKVAWAKEKILDGEVFQMIVSNGFKTSSENQDGLAFYEALRTIEPTTHLVFFDFGEHGQMAGASPEVLGSKRGDKVYYAPIAGTRYRGKTEAEDEALLQQMINDPKENAEHDMLVDLGRNDLGRVCETGSIKITKEKYAKKFANLMHLVTDLEGTIKPELDAIDFFKAIFPAGTLSGAPKIRAIDLITQIEPNRRDLYGGAMGYFSANGDMEFCIAIRSFALKDGVIKFRTGGGIVQDSVPEQEWLEVHNKAKSLCKVINYTLNS